MEDNVKKMPPKKQLPPVPCDTCANCIKIQLAEPETTIMRNCVLLPMGLPLINNGGSNVQPNIAACNAYERRQNVEGAIPYNPENIFPLES